MNWFKKFDSLSMEAKLYSGSSNNRLQTNFGAFLSILSYITIMASFVYFFYSFLQYDKPFIVQKDVVEDAPIWYNFNQIPFMIRLTARFPYSQAEKIYSISGNWITTSEVNGTWVQSLDNNIAFNRCNLSNAMSYIDLFKNVGSIDSYFCPIFSSNVDMKGYYGGVKEYSYFIAFIRQCNTTDPFANCLAQTEIDNYLDHSISYVEFLTVDNIPSQYDPDPKIPTIYSLREAASNSLQLRLWLGLHHVDYYTDYGLIFEDLTLTTFHLIEYYKQTLTLASKDKLKSGATSMILLSIYNHKVKTIYYRTYKKFQELLAQLGGIFKAISLIAELLFFTYGRNTVYLNLINSIIHITKFHQAFDIFEVKPAESGLLENSNFKLNNFFSNQSKDEMSKFSLNFVSKNKVLREKLKVGLIQSFIPLDINCSKSKNIRLIKMSLDFIYKNLTTNNLLQANYELKKLKQMLLSKEEQEIFHYLYSSNQIEESRVDDVAKALKSIFEQKSDLMGFLKHELCSNQIIEKI